MAQIYISIGSNIERERYVRQGVRALAKAFGPLELSSVYASPPVGFEGGEFYNLVAGVDTELPVLAVTALLREIEVANGRVRGAKKFSSRTLDLDLLLYDDLITDDGVQLPRDEITKNAFVLWPLAEIAGHLHHPVTGARYDALWQAYDKSQQALWAVPFDWQGADS